MKKILAGLSWLVFGAASMAVTQPDPRDSVILESKSIPGNLNGNPAFTIRVSITNKDTLANLTLPLEIKTTSGTAFIVVGYPRTFSGTINRLTSTLGNNLVFSPFINSASPDSAIWSGFWNPTDTTTAEGPNAIRKPFWELRFDSVKAALGQVRIDSADVFDNRAGFVDIEGNSVGVNFVKGIVNVNLPQSCFFLGVCVTNGNVLFGRPFVYDINSECSGTWSLVQGPGTIDPNTGVYRFSGRCSLGNIPVIVRLTDTTGSYSDCTFELNVIDNAPSCSPAQNTITVSHGQTATNQFNGSDPDAGDGVVFSKLSGPGTVGSNGAWSYTTSCADIEFSPQFIRAQATDSFGTCWPGPSATSCLFALVVTNAAPAITNCPADVVPVDTGSTFSLQLAASDADPTDAGSLLYFLVSGPAGFSVSSSGLVHWTPMGSQWGLRSATVQVRDLCGASANCQINFAVSIKKGDLNGDGQLTASDLVSQLNCIFLMIPPPAGNWACDMNCNGEHTGADAVLLLNAVFLGQPFPC